MFTLTAYYRVEVDWQSMGKCHGLTNSIGYINMLNMCGDRYDVIRLLGNQLLAISKSLQFLKKKENNKDLRLNFLYLLYFKFYKAFALGDSQWL